MGIWKSSLIEGAIIRLFAAPKKAIDGEKWGYINSSGHFKIRPHYDYAFDFQNNGLAIVEEGGLHGIINDSGDYVVLPRYRTVTSFAEGRAIVADNHGYHLINEAGRRMTSKPYKFIGMLQDGRAVFAEETTEGKTISGYLDRSGHEVIPATYQAAYDFQDDTALVQLEEQQFGLINRKGDLIERYNFPFVGHKGEGLLAFKEEQDGSVGYLYESGEIAIAPAYSIVQPFQHGVAIVGISEGDGTRYGVINREGRYLIDPTYEDIEIVSEDRLILGVTKESQPPNRLYYALADYKGTILTDFKLEVVLAFEKGVASVSDGVKTYFMNKNGHVVRNLPVVEGVGTLHLIGNLVKVFVDQRVSYYDRLGNLVWEQENTIYLNGNYRVLENKYHPNPDYLVYYPEIQGMEDPQLQKTVNAKLQELSQVKPIPDDVKLESSYTGDYSIVYYDEKLVVLEFNGYDYPFGAAHGMPYKAHAPINLETGAIYTLSDLFNRDSEYTEVLTGIIHKQIENNEEYSYIFPDAFKGIDEDQPFYVDEEALYLYFAPYEIAPYVAGFPTFRVPFQDIMDIINTNDDFWGALRYNV